ncbi:hypothetical protein HGRIS_008358 [Hohenbuehelia grisea]|uniref:F-box domain-containing protein n=1 Tax=Hohenbuehelia grisea TaxID=104357 RepID=A0ABR3J7P5_9AGAR
MSLNLNCALMLCVSNLQETILPLVYSTVQFSDVKALGRFHARLDAAEQKWDSIRRIPYSAPGRWVQALDLSSMTYESHAQALELDSTLSQLFPLVPFLVELVMSPAFVLSRRTLSSLACRDGIGNLRVLRGITYVPPLSYPRLQEEAITQLLRNCRNLVELEIHSSGPDPIELEAFAEHSELTLPDSFTPLPLDQLRTLTLLSMHSSPLMLSLLRSPLPSLRKLVITPYDDIPSPTSLVNDFINTHGAGLRSLVLVTPKSWPTRLHPSPADVLLTSPHLRHLSLENPLPDLLTTKAATRNEMHQLQILSIPRPTADFWIVLQRLLPQLPSLRAIRARDVRWLRRGMTSRAQEAGIQGELLEWRRRLLRRGIRVLDADWQENE